MSDKKTFHIIVSGKVQGVGFRYFVWQKASELELNGWVKNRPDRTVEMEVQGTHETLKTFLDFLRLGNGYSRTDHLHFSEVNISNDFSSFQIKY